MTHNTIYKYLTRLLIAIALVLAIYNKMTWKDSIKNPSNDPYIVECAFNLGIEKHEVTQSQFNHRYNK